MYVHLNLYSYCTVVSCKLGTFTYPHQPRQATIILLAFNCQFDLISSALMNPAIPSDRPLGDGKLISPKTSKDPKSDRKNKRKKEKTKGNTEKYGNFTATSP